jgi:hypothetical protein
MTVAEIYALIASRINDNNNLEITAADFREVLNAITSLAGTQDFSGLLDPWDADEIYNTTDNPLTTQNNRIWKSKVDANEGNQPPTDPLVTEDAFWIEQSPATGSPIQEWAAGVYGSGLIVVLYNNALYQLLEPVRPYTSSNIVTETTAGDWIKITIEEAPEDSNQYARQDGAWEIVNGVPDGAFDSLTAATITINPTKSINNNTKWTIPSSGPYSITWDFIDVPDGAIGMIKIIKDNSGTVRLIPVPTNTILGDDGYSEENEVGASAKTITGAANNGSGLIRITATAHGYTTGDRINIASVGGTVEANGKWTITVIDANTFDLQSSTFVTTYTSGGTATKLAKYLTIEQAANAVAYLVFTEIDGVMNCQLTTYYDAF